MLWPQASPRLDRSRPLDLALRAVKRLAVGTAHPQARNRHRLALQGFPTRLERAIHLPHAARTEGGARR